MWSSILKVMTGNETRRSRCLDSSGLARWFTQTRMFLKRHLFLEVTSQLCSARRGATDPLFETRKLWPALSLSWKLLLPAAAAAAAAALVVCCWNRQHAGYASCTKRNTNTLSSSVTSPAGIRPVCWNTNTLHNLQAIRDSGTKCHALRTVRFRALKKEERKENTTLSVIQCLTPGHHCYTESF